MPRMSYARAPEEWYNPGGCLDVVGRVWYNRPEFGRYIRKRGQLLLQQWLPAIRVVQIILCVAVIFFILLQARSAGLGSAFGGSSAGSVFKTRRGVERLVFNLTIIFIVLWALVAVFSAAVVGRLP